MRAIRVASLALIGTTALTIGAPVALAADEGDITPAGFTVSPSTVAPGGTVILNATECDDSTVTVSSGVFEPVTLDEGRPGTARIDAEAKPGAEDEVTFDCNGEKVTTALAISNDSGSLSGTGPGTEAGTEAGDSPTGTEADALDTLIGTAPGTKSETGDLPTGIETGDVLTEGEAETGDAYTGTKDESGDSHTAAKDESGDSHTGKEDSHTGQGTTKPGAGVDAGAGGSFADLSPAQIAVGSALVAGGVLGGGVMLLRRRSSEGV